MLRQTAAPAWNGSPTWDGRSPDCELPESGNGANLPQVSSRGTRHEKAHPCHRRRGGIRCNPGTRLPDASGRGPDHGFDRNGQSDDVRHADGHSPSPATGPDDPARIAGPVHERHVPVLPEHGHDAAPAATAGRYAGHAWDAEHAWHAAERPYDSSGALSGSRNAEAKLITWKSMKPDQVHRRAKSCGHGGSSGHGHGAMGPF